MIDKLFSLIDKKFYSKNRGIMDDQTLPNAVEFGLGEGIGIKGKGVGLTGRSCGKSALIIPNDAEKKVDTIGASDHKAKLITTSSEQFDELNVGAHAELDFGMIKVSGMAAYMSKRNVSSSSIFCSIQDKRVLAQKIVLDTKKLHFKPDALRFLQAIEKGEKHIAEFLDTFCTHFVSGFVYASFFSGVLNITSNKSMTQEEIKGKLKGVIDLGLKKFKGEVDLNKLEKELKQSFSASGIVFTYGSSGESPPPALSFDAFLEAYKNYVHGTQNGSPILAELTSWYELEEFQQFPKACEELRAVAKEWAVLQGEDTESIESKIKEIDIASIRKAWDSYVVSTQLIGAEYTDGKEPIRCSIPFRHVSELIIAKSQHTHFLRGVKFTYSNGIPKPIGYFKENNKPLPISTPFSIPPGTTITKATLYKIIGIGGAWKGRYWSGGFALEFSNGTKTGENFRCNNPDQEFKVEAIDCPQLIDKVLVGYRVLSGADIDALELFACDEGYYSKKVLPNVVEIMGHGKHLPLAPAPAELLTLKL